MDETFGEDPVLIGELASAMVRGYQGGAKAEEPLPKDAILACAKHFAGYSETQGGRDASEADLSHRKLESWFLPPFERVAREGCGTFMLGYESIEGVPVTFNKWLLDDRLRGAWGYRGMLVTDWDNVGRAVWEQHVKPDYVHAAADAVRTGNDLVMTTPGFYGGALEAVRAGLLDESLVDAAVERILALKFRLGLFEDPRLPDARRIGAVVGSDAHREVNLAMARESVALLRNDGALPFALPQVAGDAAPGVAGDVAAPGASAGGAGAAAPGVARGVDAAAGASGCVRAPRRIAVVGPLADDAQAQLGDWAGCSGQVGWMPDGQPRDMIVTVLDGVRDIAGRAGVEVTYARGADLVDLVPDPAGDTYPDGQPRPKVAVPAPADRALIDGAVAAARGADLVVAVVGDVVQLVGEGRSTATLELVGGQNALLEALAGVARRTGKPLVVVLMSSKPLVLPACVVGPAPTAADVRPDGTVPHCRDGEAGGAGAILWVPSPGMQGGRAIAEILFGLCEPTGRLPITFPRHAGQLPVYYNQIRGQHGDRYADLTQDPAFAFGEGLSYTAFEYGEPVVTNVPSGGAFAKDGVVHVEVPLANVGARGGTEVVQLYVGDLVTSYSWTDRELKAFRRVTLAPGERTAVAFDLPVAACTIVDANANRFVEAGEFELLVGHSSRREDLKRTVITVK